MSEYQTGFSVGFEKVRFSYVWISDTHCKWLLKLVVFLSQRFKSLMPYQDNLRFYLMLKIVSDKINHFLESLVHRKCSLEKNVPSFSLYHYISNFSFFVLLDKKNSFQKILALQIFNFFFSICLAIFTKNGTRKFQNWKFSEKNFGMIWITTVGVWNL